MQTACRETSLGPTNMACALGSLAAEGGDGLDVVLGTCHPQDGSAPSCSYYDVQCVSRLQYAGLKAAAGQAYMGVGRSLAYRGFLPLGKNSGGIRWPTYRIGGWR